MNPTGPNPPGNTIPAPATTDHAAAYFEFRLGGLRITAPQTPVRLVLMAAPLSASAAGWLLHR